MPRTRISVAFVVALATLGCQKPAPVEATPDKLVLAIGQSVTAAGLQISFKAVNSDSRCPSDVYCIQAGTAELAVTIRDAAGVSRDYVLRSFATPREVVVSGYRVRLEDVQPIPHSGAAIPPGDYRATFSATFLPD